MDNDSAGDEDALLVFRRAPASGALVLVQVKRDGDDGFATLTDFYSVVVSPDGRHVYAGEGFDPEGVLVAFERDPTNGNLTVIQADPLPAVPSASLVMSPDGAVLYAGAQARLTVLRRDAASGRVSVIDGLRRPESASGLDYIEGLAVSPDGRDVYVGATSSHAVAHLHKLCGDGQVDPGEGCDDGNDQAGDGCSASCTVEPCFTCSGDPSTCTPQDGAPCDDGNPCTVMTISVRAGRAPAVAR